MSIILAQLIGIMNVTVFANDTPHGEEHEGQAVTITQDGEVLNFDKGISDVNVLDNMLDKPMAISNELPEKYNADLNNLENVTPVKNQGNYGTCWTFASAGAMESLLMKTGLGTHDLSEIHAAYALSKYYLEDDTYGYYTKGIYNGSGNASMFDSYMTRGRDESANRYNGPVLEEDFPYPSNSMADKNNGYDPGYGQEQLDNYMKSKGIGYIPASYTSMSYRGQLLSDAEINARNKIIKNAVINNGAVAAMLYLDSSYNSDKCYQGFVDFGEYNAKDMVYYYNVPNYSSNHEVLIVGYDDTYPKENFKDYEDILTESESNYPVVPQHDGAFIVKNSWGTNWGLSSGYFYMSYDSYFNELAYYGDIISTNSYDKVYDYTPNGYQYSYGGYTGHPIAYEYTRFGANIFDRTETKTTEKISKVGTWIFRGGDYIRFSVDTDAGSGTLEEATDDLQYIPVKLINEDTVRDNTYDNKYIRVDKPGYYIFELETPVEITGSSFTVGCDYARAKFDSAGLIPTEYYNEYYSGLHIKTSGKSFVAQSTLMKEKYPGSWSSSLTAINRDIALKAYTTEEKATVTIDGEVQELSADNTITYDAGLLYEAADESGVYNEFDKTTPITENKALYTAEYIGAVDIKTTAVQNGTYEEDGSDAGSRVIGEISRNISSKISKIKEINVTLYDTNGAIVGFAPYKLTNIYENINDYNKSNDDVYVFKVPGGNKSTIDADSIKRIEISAKFKLIEGIEVIVNYLAGVIG